MRPVSSMRYSILTHPLRSQLSLVSVVSAMLPWMCCVRLPLQRRIINLEKVKLWNTWQGRCDQLRADRQLMTRCLQKAVDAQLHGAWRAWRDGSAERSSLRGLMKRAMNTPMNKAFRSWLAMLAALQQMRTVLQIALNSVSKGMECSARASKQRSRAD